MTNQRLASKLARAAFDHWQAGRLVDSAALYAEALPLADPEHCGLPEYHSEYACVLEALGRAAEALVQLERAAALQRLQDGSDTALATVLARYFLADHLVRHNEPERALAGIASSLASPPGRIEWMLRSVEAEAFAALERPSQAQSAARRALKTSPSEAKRQELAQRFAAWGSTVARSPNPSIERTSSGKRRLPPAAAHVER